jgi:hypothetical protein
MSLCWNCGIRDPVGETERGNAVKNLGIVLIIFAIIRLWIEHKAKTATAASPVTPGMAKADFVVFKSNVATTWLFLAAGIALLYHREIKSAI